MITKYIHVTRFNTTLTTIRLDLKQDKTPQNHRHISSIRFIRVLDQLLGRDHNLPNKFYCKWELYEGFFLLGIVKLKSRIE